MIKVLISENVIDLWPKVLPLPFISKHNKKNIKKTNLNKLKFVCSLATRVEK